MPKAAKTPCRQSGCRELVDKPGYCDKHKRPAWQGRKQSSRKAGRPWRRKREIVKRRDCGLCQPCQRAGRLTPFDEIDHIIPLSQGGTDDIDNLQCICKGCHQKKTGAESLAGRGY